MVGPLINKAVPVYSTKQTVPLAEWQSLARGLTLLLGYEMLCNERGISLRGYRLELRETYDGGLVFNVTENMR
jgi:hypothetical protein